MLERDTTNHWSGSANEVERMVDAKTTQLKFEGDRTSQRDLVSEVRTSLVTLESEMGASKFTAMSLGCTLIWTPLSNIIVVGTE